MVELKNVNKYFNRRRRNEIHIINNTTLSLGNNGLVAILGQSGSGKTTLLNTIGGLDKVNKGKIYINGKKITHRSSHSVDKIRNLNIGYIFQDYKLIENMTVFDNVAISLRMQGLKNKKEIAKRVNYVLNAVNMYRFRNRPCGMLSGGEKQRVAIARAIVKNPSILLADEPTGNLDSRNSIEIMNILKAISKEKLVILVTHEDELAKFYATRVIEVRDGSVANDYENTSAESLEYRLDNRVFLQDFPRIESYEKDGLKINIYSDEINGKEGNSENEITQNSTEEINEENENKANESIENSNILQNEIQSNQNKLEIKLVIKNGNIYIQTDNRKVEVVDDSSAVELIDDHYKKIDKSIYEDFNYNIDSVSEHKFKPRYSSIYGIFKSLRTGFKRISNYTPIRKVLLVGFFLSAMFLLYGISNIAGTNNIKESDFITTDPNYLYIDAAKVSVDDFEKYEKMDDVEYAVPGDGKITFQLKIDDYYQVSKFQFDFTGSVVDLNKISSEDIVLGRMPENEYEIVVDKKVINDMLDGMFSTFAYMGIKEPSELLNKTLKIDNMKDFKIVGFVEKNYGTIYVNRNILINILHNQSSNGVMGGITSAFAKTETDEIIDTQGMATNDAQIADYNLYKDDLTITKGREPKNDYEVIVNKANSDSMKLNKEIDAKVNEKKLKVVGYYDSKTNSNLYYVNNNTIKYDVITKNNGMMIYPKNKAEVYNKLKNEYKINVVDEYQKDKDDYVNQRKESTKNSMIFAIVILAISLIEIYLMIRSSFLSRIKEVGILRAIGIKKGDIYRMFTGEIFAITTIASMPGIALMTYILYELSKVKYISKVYLINTNIVGLCIIAIYIFNILVGLLPLYKVLRKTPASIIARQDLE